MQMMTFDFCDAEKWRYLYEQDKNPIGRRRRNPINMGVDVEQLDDVRQVCGGVRRHLLCHWLLQQQAVADNAMRTNQDSFSEEHF
jgi:hypothetical protein